MRDVDVGAKDEFALRFKRHQVQVELGQETILGLLADFARGAAGEIGADDGEFAAWCVKTQLDVTALGVEFIGAVTDHHLAGFVAAVHPGAGITLFLGELEIALHARQGFKAVLDIAVLRLDLLHTNTIGAVLIQPRLQAFAGGGANAVEVEAGQFEHGDTSINPFLGRIAALQILAIRVYVSGLRLALHPYK